LLADAHPDRSQKMQDKSTSALGSVNGKKLGRKRVSVFSPKNSLWKRSRVPFEVRERDAFNRQTVPRFDETLSVRRVGGITPVDSTGADDANLRGFIFSIVPHLHWARYGGRSTTSSEI
jgi:hypothetical protein